MDILVILTLCYPILVYLIHMINSGVILWYTGNNPKYRRILYKDHCVIPGVTPGETTEDIWMSTGYSLGIRLNSGISRLITCKLLITWIYRGKLGIYFTIRIVLVVRHKVLTNLGAGLPHTRRRHKQYLHLRVYYYF